MKGISWEDSQRHSTTSKLLRSADNKKVYPNSIIIKGEKREEAMPTSLIWDIRYNSELVRKENDGFNFRINKDTIKALPCRPRR
ncbi:hypothetical protein MX850_08660 [Erysipelothrix sp. Poltava]|nr:hypothetical protein MX850_08660 [Erysipelothrix sp. Poltava]